MPYCGVCRKCVRGSGKRVYSVPKDLQKRKLWEQSMGMTLNENWRICEDHFEPSDFKRITKKKNEVKRITLLPNALPKKIICNENLVDDQIKAESQCYMAIEKDPLEVEKTEANYKHFHQRKCRTCFRVFDVDENAKDLADEKNDELLYKIAVIVGVLIQCQNGMSPFMCSICVGDLCTAYDFRETCIRTEKQLREEHSVPILSIINEDNIEFDITHNNDVHEENICIDNVLAHEKEPQTAQTHDVESLSSTTLQSAETTCESVTNLITKSATSKTQKSRKPRPTKEKMLKRKHRPSARTLPLNHVCDKCGAAFRVKNNLDLHMLRHTGTKNFSCPECPKKFYDAYTRNIHVRSAHKGEKFPCLYCSKSFRSPACRYSHIRKHHKELIQIKNGQYGCPCCEKSFSSKSALKLHVSEHGPVEMSNVRHFCTFCTKSYATKGALKMHVNVHTGSTPYKCKVCDMEFSNFQARKFHQLKHDSKHPFKCDICQKGFYSPSKLKEHSRLHTGERPYSCDICNVALRYKFNLYSHRRSKMHKENLEKVNTDDIIEELS